MGVLSILRVVFTKAISFLVFMIVLMCLNVLIPLVNNQLFTNVVWFLNASILIIFMATLFLLLGSVFDELTFPTNLPAPLLNAVGSLFIVTFFLRMLYFISQSTQGKIYLNLESVYGLIYLCVFLVVLLAGYLDIIQNMPEAGWARRSRVFEKRKQEKKEPEEEEPGEEEEDKPKRKVRKKDK